MTAQDKIKTENSKAVAKPTGLELLRAPFPANQISKLPKPTKRQTEEVRQDFKKGMRCQLCGQWHHKDVVHLDYVGHAALTDRLLDCDPNWNWEPVAFSERGTPLLDENGGMWIRLTVCGHTRLGYGHPDGKKGGDAIKEVIGDALRNAAMRFGAALDLWHKGDLHGPDDDQPTGGDQATQSDQEAERSTSRQQERRADDQQKGAPSPYERMRDDMIAAIRQHGAERVGSDPKFRRDLDGLRQSLPAAADAVEAELNKGSTKSNRDLDDEIPY